MYLSTVRPTGASQNGGELSQSSGRDQAMATPRSILRQPERRLRLLTTDFCSFGRSGLVGPPLCGGSAPATPPLLQHASPTGCRHWSRLPNRKCLARPRPASPIRFPYVPTLGLPSHAPQLADSALRPGLAPALPLAKRRQTIPATAGTDSPPDCSHPTAGMHPLTQPLRSPRDHSLKVYTELGNSANRNACGYF